ncbi:MAG: hypothetical protein XD76_0534 [candidate division TA06 bacterium 32_111]|uniref:Uncharacterized protein n=1 Tax=candidate division TA06 bacterium 34_109 TaxID=1635277 RepID=A0A101I1S1_UNCT6|nr:MAG: hypothetical protein XD76_0534 [candidate division TA06 bacterium 32_111]KUK87426.1 MAG: hypothetical protein XE03_0824 [candidate division TA06 bacterium 34_109]
MVFESLKYKQYTKVDFGTIMEIIKIFIEHAELIARV